MAKDHRLLDPDRAKAPVLIIVQIRPADAPGPDPDPDIAGAGFRNRDGFDPQIPRGMDNHSAH
jgi:hypothetical protein